MKDAAQGDGNVRTGRNPRVSPPMFGSEETPRLATVASPGASKKSCPDGLFKRGKEVAAEHGMTAEGSSRRAELVARNPLVL